ncbi:hypothetical protein [Pseudarthrobacter sp. Y6]|uniref:hypothetical protein n=1 Tax=Pseudarthrobacter sp. Y6 TaxID=3418422 RepID=UPI003CF96354
MNPLLDLVEAEFKHRQFLQQFWCGPIPFRQAKKRRTPHPEQYAIAVQSIVRNLQPRAAYPERMHICYVDEYELVKSVGWAKFIESSDGHHRASFYVLATHLVFTRQGAGQHTYTHVVNDLVGLAQDASVFNSLTITALVHPNNVACKTLLTQNHWVHSDMDVDGLHEEWALVVRVED